MALIHKKELLFGKKGIVGKTMATILSKLLGVKKINYIYDSLSGYQRDEFTTQFLISNNISYSVCDLHQSNIPTKGGVVVISNHPTGALDGIMMIDMLSKKRPDVKFLGNYFLSRIEPLKSFFIDVDPFNTKNPENISGIRKALEHLESGGMLVIFPAGEVSTYSRGFINIEDKPWSKSMIKFIRRSNLPILPIYIDARNSRLFHIAGMINPILRTALLPHELINKNHKNINIAIGAAISSTRMSEVDSMETYGTFLRSNVYLLKESLDIEATDKQSSSASSVEALCAGDELENIKQISVDYSNIIQPIDPKILDSEIKSIREKSLLFDNANYSVLIAGSEDIPNVMIEIGRLREITFRQIGEGTDNEIDTDQYDDYYKQMFIWDNEAKRIVGAYRIGFGKEIIKEYGLNGFYTNSLFKMSDPMIPIMDQSIELGRSFVVFDYQKKPATLMMLWKGILHILLKNDQYRYLIGPVTISGEFTEVSKLLIVDYIKRSHFDYLLARNIKPLTGLADLKRHMPSTVIDSIFSIDALNKIITDIEKNRFSIPVLIKKYLQLGGRVIGFNVDPQFNDALDALLLVDLKSIPEASLIMLSKESDIDISKRFS